MSEVPPPPSVATSSAGRAKVWKERASTGLVILASVALFVAVVTSWSEGTLFNSNEFASRAVVVLDSGTVRDALAQEITNELIENGPSTLASFRSLLVGIVGNVLETDAFKSVFRVAVEQAHHAVFREHAGHALLSLGEGLALFTSSTEESNPGLASQLPTDASKLLIDVSPIVQRLHPWIVAERVERLEIGAWIVATGAAIAAVVLGRRRRIVVRRLGIGVVLAGAGIVGLTLLLPRLAVTRISNPDLIAPVSAAVGSFTGDLERLGVWIIPIGVIIASAAASTGGPPHLILDARATRDRLTTWTRGGWSSLGQVGAGTGLVLVGALLILGHEIVVPLLVMLAGAYAIYVGLVVLFGALMASVPEPAVATGASRAHRWEPRLAIVGFGVLVLLALAFFGLQVNVSTAAAQARVASVMSCNGSPQLCDRRLDQVVFPASHNSMSAADDPGWVFAENLHGIPAQLQYGIRAFLVKTHYGIPTGISEGNGAQLVVTDRDAEIAVGSAEDDAELSPGELNRAVALEKSTPKAANTHAVYLCHVYCSLGATDFVQTLDQIRHFLDRNPDNVLILFIGDYVSAADNAKAFAAAKLTDRLWDYDTHRAPPTLRQMIDSRRNVLVLTEHSHPPPSWYTKGYGIFQDTPFTFTTPAKLAAPSSCEANRGSADAPLFEINHFITNAQPPSAKSARTVNAHGFLMDRVRRCEAARHLKPTIIAVDFYDQGDLLGVVDDLNGVSK